MAAPRKVDVGGHGLRVTLSGGGAPDFLCLHGLVDSIEIWHRLTPELAERGCVALVDQRGHGASDAPPGPYRREDLAADAVAVVRALGGDEAVLVGHSMGGIVSMTAAIEFPQHVAGLVLIGTASQCNEKTAQWYERIAQAGEAEGVAGLARTIYGKSTDKVIRGEARGIAHVTRALGSLYTDPLTPKLSAISCPVLLIVGENDPMGPKASAIIADGVRDAELVTVPECGHWVHVERPQAVIEAIDRFLPRLSD